MKAIPFTILLVACAWAGNALAATAGVFQFVSGDVQIALAGGSGRPAAKGSPIEVGDIIVSARASMAQLKMGDGAIIVVQPESRLTVTEFSYAGKEDGTEKVRFRLEQGGFRSITGAIGHTNKGNYTIETPIAHIGVRGTDHESWYFPSRVSTDGVTTEAGLYNRVTVGATYIQNGKGEVVIGPNQVGYASTAVDRPHLLGAMPEFFNRSVQPRSVRIAPQSGAITAQGGAQQGASGATSGSSGSLAGFTAPRGKEGVSFGQTAVNPTISPSGATLANAGSDPALGVNWGTWQGGVTRVNGRPTTGDVNFISTTNLTTVAQLAALPPQVFTGTSTGTYNYVPGSGAVTGTGSASAGVINSLSVGVNFSTATVTSYSVNATVGSQTWTGNGSGTFTQYMSSSGIAIDGKCSGCTPGAGSPTSHGTATGALVGSQAEGMTTAFGMKAANQSMSGTGLLSR